LADKRTSGAECLALVKKDTKAPIRQPSEPPYRYHWPAAVLVMRTLPLGLPIARKNVIRIQPTAGSRPAPNVPMPAPDPTQVRKMTTTRRTATHGAGDWPYWKLPIRPWIAPSTNSIR
jgi:hypothetical protein